MRRDLDFERRRLAAETADLEAELGIGVPCCPTASVFTTY